MRVMVLLLVMGCGSSQTQGEVCRAVAEAYFARCGECGVCRVGDIQPGIEHSVDECCENAGLCGEDAPISDDEIKTCINATSVQECSLAVRTAAVSCWEFPEP